MIGGDYEPTNWGLTYLFQCEERFAQVWFRKGIGEYWVPPGFSFWVPIRMLAAAVIWSVLVWGFGFTLGANDVPGARFIAWGVVPAGEVIAVVALGWLALLAATWVLSARMSKENDQRAERGEEILRTNFVGWPRFSPAPTAWRRGKSLQRWHYWRAVVERETTLGLVAAALLYPLAPPVAVYVAAVVWYFSRNQMDAVKSLRRARLKVANDLVNADHTERLLEEFDLENGSKEERE